MKAKFVRFIYKIGVAKFLFPLSLLLLTTRTEVAAQNSWEQTNGPNGGAVLSLIINSVGDIFAGTDRGGTFRSADNGDNWTTINFGLTNLDIRSLAISSSGHIFVGTNGGGIFRSTNNGDNWTAVNFGLANLDLRSLAINSSGHIFVGTSGGGVFRSTNNGNSWTAVNTGLTNATVFAFAINSTGHIFAGTDGGGIFRSTNNGDSWTAIMPSATVLAFAINSTGQIFAGTDGGGLFRSTDNGDSWTAVNIGLTNTTVFAFAINSTGHIFAGTNGGGIFRSTNNGDSWTAVNTGLPSATVLAFAINSTGHIFAGTDGGGVYRSVQSNLIPIIFTNPSTMTFSAAVGGTNPPSLPLQISNSGGATLHWSVSDNQPWLSLAPSSGSSTGEIDNVNVAVNVAGLPPGTHQAQITISAAGASNTPQFITVTLTLASPNPPPTLTSISPTSGTRLQTLNVVFIGTNFISGVTDVSFGVGITVNSTTFSSSSQITANITISSNAVGGPRNISVINVAPGGGASGKLPFIVNNPVPTLSGISPNSGSQSQTLNVVFVGTNFFGGATAVSFGADITVNATTVNSSNQIAVNITIGSNAAIGARDVFATNAPPGGGTSVLVNAFSVDIAVSLSAPSNLTVVAVSSTQIILIWEDNSSTEAGFKIERRLDTNLTYEHIATVAADRTGFSNTNLSGNTKYCFRVQAFNAAGNSSFSNEACATTSSNQPPIVTNVIPNQILQVGGHLSCLI